MNPVTCPICEEKIKLENDVKFLGRLTCPTCEALLEIVNLDPLELDWIYYDEHYASNGRERNKQPSNAVCPICRDAVFIGPSHMKVGERILCPGCEVQLEIVNLIPLELDWSYDSGYDYYVEDDDTFEEYYDDYQQ